MHSIGLELVIEQRFVHSFAVAACGGDRSVDVDLSCSAFSKHGNFMEAAFHSCPSILSGSVRHCGDNPTGSTSPDHDSEIVHVYPALIPEECCLLMFTVTGDLSSSSTLAVSCYAKEKKKSKVRRPRIASQRQLRRAD